MKDVYDGCNVCSYVPDEAMVLAQNEHWLATLRDDDQTLLGTTIITALRHVPEVDYLTPAEVLTYTAIQNLIFGGLRRAFQPQTFNLSCLKNNAFVSTDTPPEAGHVHYHVKPRYAEPVTIAGQSFSDPMPGRYLTSFKRYQPTRNQALTIAATVRSYL